MKLPGMRPSLEAVGGFLLRHGEKVVGSLALLAALAIAWSGIDAVRSQGVKDEQQPDEIQEKAEEADTHVGRAKEAPRDFLATHAPLPERLDAWRLPVPPWRGVAELELADPPPLSLLDKPLFEELAKRTKPEVFPVEDLHAAAGIALLATKAPAGGRDVAPAATGSGKLTPYVVVTGLIPAAKQRDEYRSRFQGVGFKDAKRDAPLWSDFELERTAVVPGAADTWEPIDLAVAARSWAREWAALEPGQLPPTWQLAANEDARSPQTTPVAFCGPLPTRVDDGWGLDELHPRIVAQLAAQPRPKTDRGDREPEAPSPDAGPGGPGFDGAPAEPKPAERPPQKPAAQASPHRLLRFIDTNVEVGRSYRYRARLKLWNPNVGLAPQHVADPGLAKEQKLASPPSAASNVVMVPGTVRILAGTVPKEIAKRLRLKPGTAEILVLAPTGGNQGYALRALYGEPGMPLDVEAKPMRTPVEIRTRGEPVSTGVTLIDIRGRQGEREPVTGARGGGRKVDRELVPEPLEMLCLRGDGSFDFVSAADAERDVLRHASTLPPLEDSKREDRRAPADEAAPVSDNPFATPAPGQRP
jgi:hypothetical protein